MFYHKYVSVYICW